MVSAYRAYIDELTAAACSPIEDRLRIAVADRLAGGGPALQRDERDLADVLLVVYRMRRRDNDLAALRRLRQVAATLVMDALYALQPQNALDGYTEQRARFDMLAALVVWFEIPERGVADPLAAVLSQQLWGFLNGSLRQPFTRLAELDGRDLEVAVRAFDLWLAVASELAGGTFPDHVVGAIFDSFSHTAQRAAGWLAPRAEQLRLLILGYRAAVLVQPCKAAGRDCLFRQFDALLYLRRVQPRALERWWGFVSELATRFESDPALERHFLAGLVETARDVLAEGEANATRTPAHGLFEQTVECLGMREALERERAGARAGAAAARAAQAESRKIIPFDPNRRARAAAPAPDTGVEHPVSA